MKWENKNRRKGERVILPPLFSYLRLRPKALEAVLKSLPIKARLVIGPFNIASITCQPLSCQAFFNNFEVSGFANFLDYEHLIGKLTGVSQRIFRIAGESHRPLLLPGNRAIGFVYL